MNHTCMLMSIKMIQYDIVKEALLNGPFPHYAPVSKHKEMRTRLGWIISYKSLYCVHLSLELVPLFTEMQERSV